MGRHTNDRNVNLKVRAEQRIGREVLAAAHIRMDGWKPSRYVLVLSSDGVLWWIAIQRRWPLRLGAVAGWLELAATLHVHTTHLGPDRFGLEISRVERLDRGKLHGQGAAELVGHLFAREFVVS